MKAFHGDPAVKEKYLARLKAHHEADEIIQGAGFNDGHGCAVGCTLNKYDHSAYENELGLPQWLAHLEDRVFEGLPLKKAQQFAVDFLEAVPAGADVDKVRWQLAFQRHTRARDRLLLNKEAYAVQCVAAIEQVMAYCELEIKGSAESAESAVHYEWEAKTLLELLRAAPQAA
jgi:hypothetical protein